MAAVFDGFPVILAGCRGVFRNFYIAKGRARWQRRVAYYAPQVGVEPQGIAQGVRSPLGLMLGRGQALFPSVLMAPQTIIDYMVVHELCHLCHRDHADAFWNEVDKMMSDFRERKEWLRKNGAGLDV